MGILPGVFLSQAVKDPMLVPRTGRIWESVCSGGLSPSWFGVKILDSAVAGLLKEHLRTLQAPFITSNKRKSLSSSESSVYSTHPILNKGQTSQYIHREIISFSPLHQRGHRSQDPPYSTPSLNFKHTIRPNPSPPKKPFPKTSAHLPMPRNGTRHHNFDDASIRGLVRNALTWTCGFGWESYSGQRVVGWERDGRLIHC
jgi:hypothetical protein